MNKKSVKGWIIYEYMEEAGLDMSDDVNKALLQAIVDEIEDTVKRILKSKKIQVDSAYRKGLAGLPLTTNNNEAL